MAKAHIPQRRCLGCGAHAPKRELARFVVVGAGEDRALMRDDRGLRPGRGLYVCQTHPCFDRAVERRAFFRAARLVGGPLRIDTTLADGFDG